MKMWEIENQINGRSLRPVSPSIGGTSSLANGIPQRSALADAAATLSMSSSMASLMTSCYALSRSRACGEVIR
ncbi:hypothetical protein [Gordonia sp. CPCC 205333]|uniref:hypothetical protein n=1 Tax=Gordonia sp. CPCC 205333 TaxID=3140790 RepID=UPI003AF3C822